MNRVIVKNGEQKKLQELFGVCHVVVSRALKGKKNNLLAQRIRKAAIERGGFEVTIVENKAAMENGGVERPKIIKK